MNKMYRDDIETKYGRCFLDNRAAYFTPYNQHKCGIVYFDLHIDFETKRVILCKDDYVNRCKNMQSGLLNPYLDLLFFRCYPLAYKELVVIDVIRDFFDSKPITGLACAPFSYARLTSEEESFFCRESILLEPPHHPRNPFTSGVLFYKVSDYHNVFACYKMEDIIMSINNYTGIPYRLRDILLLFFNGVLLPYVESKCSKSRRIKLLPMCREVMSSISADEMEEAQSKILGIASTMLECVAKSNKKLINKLKK